MKPARHITILFLAAIVLAFTLQKGNCFLLVLLLPFFLAYLIYTAARMIRRHDERKERGIRLAVWCIVLALAGFVQAYWSIGSSSDANSALEKVSAYRERSGKYPASLREAGLEDKILQEKWNIRYSLEEGKPRLTYPAPVMPLSMYEYDFEARAWRMNAY